MLHWKCGFEIELLAPVGKSRKDIARQFAKQNGYGLERIFYPQSEPSLVDGMDIFQNLVLGFRVFDKAGNTRLTCVDDLTIQSDLNREKSSRKGWYRIVSDDMRLLNLAMIHCDAKADQRDVLKPIADLFDTALDGSEKDMFKVEDRDGKSIAICPSLPGERERPCELISPPLTEQHGEYLSEIMEIADALGFSVPREAAVHVHFDGERLQNAKIFSDLVVLLNRFSADLRKMVGFNPNCTRLGGFPTALLDLISKEAFKSLSWKEAKEELSKLELSKYCDYNLLNLVKGTKHKHTFEVRIFPGSMDHTVILEQARLFESILKFVCSQKGDFHAIKNLRDLLKELDLSEKQYEDWLPRC